MFSLAKIQNGHQRLYKMVTYNEFNIYCNTSFLLNFSRGAHVRSFIKVLKPHSCFTCKKNKMTAWYNTETVTYGEIQIYFFVISFFCIIFQEKLNYGSILTLWSFCHITIQNGRHKEKRTILKIMSFFSTYFFISKHSGSQKYFLNQCGNAMWFSPVRCSRCCSSLSCDNFNERASIMPDRQLT